MSLSEACDEILGVGILQHEYGIPTLWLPSTPQVQKPDLESEYYELNKTLAARLDRLVFLNRVAELRQKDPQAVGEFYAEAFDSGLFPKMTFTEKESHLRGMARFKSIELTSDFLTQALPVLRSIYQENSSLTDAEFTILNNLKKLYSHYNDHPANIRRLLREYNAQKASLAEEGRLQKEIQDFIAAELKPRLIELESLNNEYLALQNTYENRLSARDTSTQTPNLKKLRQAALTLSRRTQRLRTLCDFLPNLVLCQASNWFSDKGLLAVVEECQDLAERLDMYPEPRELRSVEEILKVDFEKLDL